MAVLVAEFAALTELAAAFPNILSLMILAYSLLSRPLTTASSLAFEILSTLAAGCNKWSSKWLKESDDSRVIRAGRMTLKVT